MRWTNSLDEIANAHDAVVFSQLLSKLLVVWRTLEILPNRLEPLLGQRADLLLLRPLQAHTLN